MAGSRRHGRAAAPAALAILAAFAAEEAARADQAAILEPAVARRAAERLAPGMVIVSWAYPKDAPCELAPPDLLRVREVIVVHGPDGTQVAVVARRLASASSPATPAEEGEEEGSSAEGSATPATATAAASATTPTASAETPTPSAGTPTPSPATPTASPAPGAAAAAPAGSAVRLGWNAAPAGPAERMPIDLAYVYVPEPGRPGRYTNLAAQVGLSPDVASLEIAVDPAILRAVGGE